MAVSAVDTTDRIKLSADKPRFVPGPTLKAKKMYLSCVTLPDGTLIEAGGGTDNLIEAASYEVGLLKSINSSWSSMNCDSLGKPPALSLRRCSCWTTVGW